MAVKKTHYLQAIFSHRFDRVYGAVCAADVQKGFHCLSPNIAVPILTRVAPSLMATSKSPVIPIDSSSRDTFGQRLSFYLIPQFTQIGEKRLDFFRLIKIGRHGHQAFNAEVFQLADLCNQPGGLIGRNSRIWCLPR